VVRDERSDLMSRINERVNREGQSLGIEIVDVRIRRADLPEANSQAIYQRMQTEREREATEIRAQGEQAARRIRAEADRTATVIVAEANRESEQIRGDGDAERTNIFAQAYGRDPEFFDFYRSMQAYQVGLKPNATRMLLSPDTEFFRYFNSDAAPSGDGNSVPGETAVEPSAESGDAGEAQSGSQSSAAANSDANSSPPATTMTDANESGAMQDNSGSEAAPASTQ